jgi:SAM-dependent methyltransferase
VQPSSPPNLWRACDSNFGKRVPEALLVGAAAEAIPLATGSLSAVTVAQAFHWFRPELAQSEIHRVLKPGGSLGIIGCYRYDRKVPWVLRLIALSNRYRRGPRKRLRAQLEKAWATAIEAAPPVASMLSLSLSLSLFASAKSKLISLPNLFTLDREHRFYDYQELDVEACWNGLASRASSQSFRCQSVSV